MKIIRDLLIIVVLGGLVVYAVFSFIASTKSYNLGVDVTYGQAMRACEEDERICSFSSVEGAKEYLSSPDHLASVRTRELKKQQDLEAQKAGAKTESTKHRKSFDHH